MKFIIGIGNPEPKYKSTRHNVGFDVLDFLAARSPTKARWKTEKSLQADVCETAEATLVRPLTYVNRTGDAVTAIRKKFDIEGPALFVVCDDVNLAFGKIRIRPEGGPGGHHGLESVIGALGSENFPRLRIGVANERMPKDDVAPFVLGKFDSDEAQRLDSIVEKAASVCEAWARDGFEAAQNQLSRLLSNG